ncbi:hypothetical protein QC762_0115480 [Podospora pseudocomata]|uniref:Uncharacterized protein n=1 Tax=Podospora pseudocomata TaxID=2093779 RepID=A0ABR0G5S3_9PEZI|nr:hypothetical protein QC762_0115480 [Podospora pseudocomata]
MPISIQPQCGQKKTGPSRPGKGDPDPEIGLYVEGISISGPGITPQEQGAGDPAASNQAPRKAQTTTKTTGAGTSHCLQIDDPNAAEPTTAAETEAAGGRRVLACGQLLTEGTDGSTKPPQPNPDSSLKPAAAPPPITGGWSSKLFQN